MLRVLILFACFAIGLYKATSNDTVQIVRRYQMECVEETRFDPDIIVKIKKGNWRMPREQEQLVKDWSLCVLMKCGLMTKQGVYKIDVALEKVPESDRDQVEKTIDSCLSTKAIPAPDIALNFVKCYQRVKTNHTSVSIF